MSGQKLLLVLAAMALYGSAAAPACVITCQADVVVNRLTGQLYGNKQTIPGAEVRLYRVKRMCAGKDSWTTANLERSTTTDDYGRFGLGKLRPGLHDLVIKRGDMVWYTTIRVIGSRRRIESEVNVHVIEKFEPGMTDCWDVGEFAFSTYEKLPQAPDRH